MLPLPRVLVMLALAGSVPLPLAADQAAADPRSPLLAPLAVPALSGPLASGLSWYLRSHTAERMFDAEFEIKAYALESRRYFGGFVRWEFRGLYLGRASRVLERDVDPETGRTALAFATLERRLGWPVLQRILFAVAERPERNGLDAPAFVRIASDTAGQDVSWFAAMLDGASTFDPAIRDFSSEQANDCPSAPCYRTTVAVERRGNAAIPSTVRATFSDGQQVEARWNGEDAASLFFESPAPASDVAVDPDRTLLVDANTLNNRRTAAPSTDVPVAKWTARWVVWLQQTLLTYGFLF